jgi:predicted nucleic acid-binding protein
VTYLADTSAVVCIGRRQVAEEWRELVSRGLVAICEPVLCEALTIADKSKYGSAELELKSSYSWVPVPDNVWSLVGTIRRELAAHSVHQGVSVADYLIVATAIKSKLVLLHEDGDFETVARFVPQLQQQRISEVS